jgi:hypothetical protein
LKLFVSTQQTQKQRENDFCWVPENEIVIFGTECDNGSVDDYCGCRRSMTGIDCLKATTTMKVVEIDITREIFINKICNSLVKAGWYATVKESVELATEIADYLIYCVEPFSEGAIVERREDVMIERN